VQLIEGQLVFSASDLVGDLACGHLTTLAREAAFGERRFPFRDDPQLDLIRRRGGELEERLLSSFRGEGRRVLALPVAPRTTLAALRQAEAETLAAMQDGVDVIAQATFFDGRWHGRADFLLRVDRPSVLGAWSYEVADAKLAREVRAAAVLQLCVYSERLATLQGVWPESQHVVTGDGRRHAYRCAEVQAYYRAARARFETRMTATPAATYPEPVEHCRVCSWYPVCAEQRRSDDHLCRVAGMSRRHTSRFVDAGITTLTRLGRRDPDAAVPGIGAGARERLTRQARLQLAQYADGRIRYEWLDRPEPEEFGLAHLPAPSPLDVFLDIEADPWIVDGGIEYLLGVVTEVDGEPEYVPIWAHTREQEKEAFDRLMGLLMDRLARDPHLHVYHYGAYEDTALKRLASRHAIRQDDLDRLLRGDVLVDLHRVLVRSMRVSEESYSLKKIERLYQAAREGPVTHPGFALVQYERWVETSDETLLADLQAYNRDDGLSIWRLRAWLEARRREWEEKTESPLARPASKDGAASEDVERIDAEIAARVALLTDGVPADAEQRTDEQQARWLLAQLLDWHRREEKPQWWLHFDHLEKSPEELFESTDALVDLRFVDVVGTRKSSSIVRYSYDTAQEHTFKVGDSPYERPSGKGAGEIVRVDRVAGTIDIVRGPSKSDLAPEALVPAPPINTRPLRDGIQRVADAVLVNGIDGGGPYRAARDLLLRRPPCLHDARLPITRVYDTPLDVAVRAATSLNDTYLPVQGPPGTGKTYTGARMILELVRAGSRVGITASAHDAITNMLKAVCEAADEADLPLRIVQKADGDVACPHASVTVAARNEEVVEGLTRGTFQIAAGTAWLFARKEMETRLDVLFVDEAGQMSLANVVAMGGAARSIVLLGDPNQLPQVTQGTHPEGAAVSALEHVLGERKTIPPEQGLFLEETWRMHPSVCRYISDAFYDGRLSPHASTAAQALAAGGFENGVRLVPVEHEACSVRSEAEAERVADIVEELLGGHWTDASGATRRLTLRDIMIVAPYNAQVAEITRTVRARVAGVPRVGTVDRFQGQEAPVALYSMTTSTPEDAPRQMEFLYSSHRLNVALSRARGLAILVVNPRLLEARCRTVEQMRLMNAFCRLQEIAAVDPAAARALELPRLH
jgi:predicted RecB family nuclease